MSLQKSAVVNLTPEMGFVFPFIFFSFSVCLSSLCLSGSGFVSLCPFFSLKFSVALCLCFLIDSSGVQRLQQVINAENSDSKSKPFMNADQLGEETTSPGIRSENSLCKYRNASHGINLLYFSLGNESQVQVSQQN